MADHRHTFLALLAATCLTAHADDNAILLADTVFIHRLSDSTSSRVVAPAGATVAILERMSEGVVVSFAGSEPRLLPADALRDLPSVPGPQGPQAHGEE